jgi:hypothetical protein
MKGNSDELPHTKLQTILDMTAREIIALLYIKEGDILNRSS